MSRSSVPGARTSTSAKWPFNGAEAELWENGFNLGQSPGCTGEPGVFPDDPGGVNIFSASFVAAADMFGNGYHYLIRYAIYGAIGLG